MKGLLSGCFALVGLLALGQTAPDPDRLIAIFVIDGLRPDSINTGRHPDHRTAADRGR